MKCVLIDDDQDDIDIFGYTIKEMNCGIEFTGYINFEKALNDLSDFSNGNQVLPDYIFFRCRHECC